MKWLNIFCKKLTWGLGIPRDLLMSDGEESRHTALASNTLIATRSPLKKGSKVNDMPSNHACPECGSDMVRRERSDGSPFWGCSTFSFSACQGARPIDKLRPMTEAHFKAAIKESCWKLSEIGLLVSADRYLQMKDESEEDVPRVLSLRVHSGRRTNGDATTDPNCIVVENLKSRQSYTWTLLDEKVNLEPKFSVGDKVIITKDCVNHGETASIIALHPKSVPAYDCTVKLLEREGAVLVLANFEDFKHFEGEIKEEKMSKPKIELTEADFEYARVAALLKYRNKEVKWFIVSPKQAKIWSKVCGLDVLRISYDDLSDNEIGVRFVDDYSPNKSSLFIWKKEEVLVTAEEIEVIKRAKCQALGLPSHTVKLLKPEIGLIGGRPEYGRPAILEAVEALMKSSTWALGLPSHMMGGSIAEKQYETTCALILLFKDGTTLDVKPPPESEGWKETTKESAFWPHVFATKFERNRLWYEDVAFPALAFEIKHELGQATLSERGLIDRIRDEHAQVLCCTKYRREIKEPEQPVKESYETSYRLLRGESESKSGKSVGLVDAWPGSKSPD